MPEVEISSANPAQRITPSLADALRGRPVSVGTRNQAKCNAVREALATLQPSLLDEKDAPFSEIQVLPCSVESGVDEQPIGFEEIAAGARNRARAALASGETGLAFGIEDGLVPLFDGRDGEVGEAVFNFGCAWVTDGERSGSGFSSGFAYPAECRIPAIRDREPIGDLFDALWRKHRDAADRAPSGPAQGNIGKLTDGRLTRSDYGSHAVLCALVRFLQPDLYD